MDLKKIKNILIDFGGVLYEINPMNSIIRFSEISGVSENILSSPDFYNTHIAPFEKGIYSVKEFINYLCRVLNINITEEEFEEIWLKTLIAIYPDSINIMLALKKRFRLFLLSNTNLLHYKKFSKECEQLFKIFDKTYFSFNIGLLKPEKEIFRYVEKDANLKPSETLFIDDSLANINSADILGYRTLHLTDRKFLSDLLHIV